MIGLTAAVTVLAGTTVFVLGQFVLKWLIEPVQEYKELKGAASYALLYYANISGASGLVPPDEVVAARVHLRGLASRLRKTYAKVPLYGVCARLGLVPPPDDLLEASTQFVGWSNSLGPRDGSNLPRRQTIARCLDIDGVY